jgi:hypothetical protein
MHRNVCCPAYDFCLSDAARTNQSFDCTRCGQRHTHEMIPWEEIEPCILLLWAAYRPERWRAYNQLRIAEAARAGAAVADTPEDDAGDCMDPDEIVEPCAPGAAGFESC